MDLDNMLKIYQKKKGNEKYHCTLSKPIIVDYFTINLKDDRVTKDMSGLKYVPDGFLKGNKISKKFWVKIKYTQPLIIDELPKNILWRWVEENENQSFIQNTEFITFRNILSEIMVLPFKKKKPEDFYVVAELKHGKIFLYEKEIDVRKEYNNPENKYRLNNYKRFLFTNVANTYEPYSLQISDNSFKNIFYEIFQIKLGKHQIVYSTEIDGIHDEKLIDNLGELIKANHFDGKLFYYRRKLDWKLRRTERFNQSLEMWSQMKFSLSENIITATYCLNENFAYEDIYDERKDKQDWKEVISDVKTINVDSLPRRCPKKWNPNASLRFLNEFLNSVKRSINMVPLTERNTTVWTFKCTSNFEIMVDINRTE